MKQIDLHKKIRMLHPYKIFLFILAFISLNSFDLSAQRVYKHWSDVNSSWINGNLNKNNSNYTEGETVPHVYVAGGLINNTSYQVDLIYNYYWSTSNSSGFTQILPYNTDRSPASLNGTTPVADVTFTNFYTVNATITSVSSPVASGSSNIDQTVTVTFTYTGSDGGSAEIYFGLYLAKPHDVGTTNGAASWSGASLQTTKNDDGGSQSLQINPDAIQFFCTTQPPEPITGTTSVCVGSTTQLSDVTTGGVWSSDDETIATVDQTGLVTGIAQGTVTIRYTTVDANGCGGTVTTTVTVNPLPTVTVNSPTKCANDAGATITATPGSGAGSDYDYAWTVPSGATDPGNVQSFSATVAGQYCVVITNKTTGCASASGCGTLTVNPNPTVTVNSPIKCANDPAVTITATPQSGEGSDYDYAWTFPSGATDPGNVQSFSATVAGQYCVVITNKTTSCSSASGCGTLTVNPNPPCTITSSGSPTTATVGTPVTFNGPAQIGTYQYTWALTANTSGATFVGSHSGTDATVTVKTSTVGSYTLTLSVTNTATGCTSVSACSYKITSTPAGPFFTYTQGFYGNSGGSACLPSGSSTTTAALITSSINNMVNKTLYLGSSGKSFTMVGPSLNNVTLATQVTNLIKIMPGGTTPSVLAGNYNVTASSAYPPLSSGKIKDVLLAQAITLAINISIPGSTLGSFPLQTGYLTTINRSGTSCTAGPATCPNGIISSLKVLSNAGLVAKLNNQTVADLLSLASSVLGGGALPTGVSLSDINNAIDAVNRSFDGGRFFLGYYSTAQSCGTVTFSGGTNAAPMVSNLEATKLSATAYPNPFTDKVTFSVVSPVSGKASLDIYNIMGQKLHTVYQGYLFAGRGQVIEYNVPSTFKGGLIYTLKVGDQQVNGKLIQVK